MHNQKEIWEKVYEGHELPWIENPAPDDLVNDFISSFKARKSVILDYGCAKGRYLHLFTKAGLDVIGLDISENALNSARKKVPDVQLIQAESPSIFLGENVFFDGVFAYGVMHHIDKEMWPEYMDSFYEILKPGGVLLISGHSTEDAEFSSGYRISPTTGKISYAVDDIGKFAENASFYVGKTGSFDFEEAFTQIPRVFKYFFLQK